MPAQTVGWMPISWLVEEEANPGSRQGGLPGSRFGARPMDSPHRWKSHHLHTNPGVSACAKISIVLQSILRVLDRAQTLQGLAHTHHVRQHHLHHQSFSQ